MRILVVDDEYEVLEVVARALSAEGHVVTTAGDISTAEQRIREGTDLIVLDVRLPDGTGVELCKWIRKGGSELPILLLTAFSDVALRVQGLDAGADDFLAKPFAIAELRARVRALGRRRNYARSSIYQWGDISINFSDRTAKRQQQIVAVTSREWALLELLAAQAGRTVSRVDIMESVWGDISESAEGSLEVLIARLRRKFGHSLIQTLRGTGYRMEESNALPS